MMALGKGLCDLGIRRGFGFVQHSDWEGLIGCLKFFPSLIRYSPCRDLVQIGLVEMDGSQGVVKQGVTVR
jgi:hypothetical protein